MRKPTQAPSVCSPATLSSPWTTVLRIIKNACCIFTGCSVLLVLVNWAISGSLDDTLIFADGFLMLYPFSLAVAAAHLVRKSDKMGVGAKCILHPLLCLLGIFLVYLPYMVRNAFPVASVMVHLFAFAVAYGLVTAVACVISLAFRKRGDRSEGHTEKKEKEKRESYTPVFGQKDRED